MFFQTSLAAFYAISKSFFWFSKERLPKIEFQFIFTISIYSNTLRALRILRSVSWSDFFVLYTSTKILRTYKNYGV